VLNRLECSVRVKKKNDVMIDEIVGFGEFLFIFNFFWPLVILSEVN
jgi:hypothetical protein